jgi:hypothetical protein
MSIQAVAWALEQDIRDPHQKLILISLANHADHTTGLCWPSHSTIAREASCDRRTVIRRLPMLEVAGYIEIKRSTEGKRKLVNTYRLLVKGSVQQTLPKGSPTAVDNAAGQCPPVTRGSDSAVTTKNHHITITSPLPSSHRSPVEKAKGLGSEGVPKGRPSRGAENASVIQSRVATKLGNGDVAAGWLLFGGLSDWQRNELTAQERAGRLDADALLWLKLDWSAARPP